MEREIPVPTKTIPEELCFCLFCRNGAANKPVEYQNSKLLVTLKLLVILLLKMASELYCLS